MTAVLEPTDEDVSAAVGGVPESPKPLTRQELRLRFWLKFWAASFALEVGLYVWWAWGGEEASRSGTQWTIDATGAPGTSRIPARNRWNVAFTG